MKVALYARVSRDDKDQDPERQLMKCRAYCEVHNHTIVGEWKEECTGDSDPFKRVECAQALASEARAIVIYSMDRFTRQHPLKVMRVIEQMKNQGLKIVSITEPMFNMENEMSDVMLYLITWFNNYFLKKLREDIKSGIDRARAQGKRIGRPQVKFNTYRARQLLSEGKSQRAVSQELGVSLATVNRFKKGLE